MLLLGCFSTDRLDHEHLARVLASAEDRRGHGRMGTRPTRNQWMCARWRTKAAWLQRTGDRLVPHCTVSAHGPIVSGPSG